MSTVANMADNELVLLHQVLQERQNDREIPLREDDAFELFACEQVLRNRDLSAEEVAAGMIGGGSDGAIDGVYVFLGDELLSEDSDVFQEGFAPTKHATSSPGGRNGWQRPCLKVPVRTPSSSDDLPGGP